MNKFSAPPILSSNFLVPLFGTSGVVAICAPHPQIDAALTQVLTLFADGGEHIAVIVADNHFDAYAFARRIDDEHLKVARAETPHQVRRLVQRLLATHTSYSVAVVIGLLEPFYDEQVQWQMARHLLTDILQLLDELARTLRVLVLVSPPPNATRSYLKEQLTQAAAHSIELPTLAPAKQALEGRLF